MNVERLLELADHLEFGELGHDEFYYGVWSIGLSLMDIRIYMGILRNTRVRWRAPRFSSTSALKTPKSYSWHAILPQAAYLHGACG